VTSNLPETTNLETSTSNDEDAELVARCVAELPHCLDAYQELVTKYEGLVFGTCKKMLGSLQDAEEVTQDSFLRIFHKIHQFEGRSTFKTWMFRIVYNFCLTRRKKLAMTRERLEVVQENQSAKIADSERLKPGGAMDRDENVREALGKLSEDDEKVICLRFVSDLSLEQMAEILDMKLSATKMRLYRAMEKFKVVYAATLEEKKITARGIEISDNSDEKGDAA